MGEVNSKSERDGEREGQTMRIVLQFGGSVLIDSESDASAGKHLKYFKSFTSIRCADSLC